MYAAWCRRYCHPMGNEEDVLGGGEEGKLLKTPFVDKEPQ